jgi:hypothetical protein
MLRDLASRESVPAMKTTTMLLAGAMACLAGATGCDDKPAAPKPADTAPPAPPTATAAPTPPPTASAAPSFSGPTKVYDCGAKDQKPCPMQGWMKTVMASAASSGEGDKLASALTFVAVHVPPGCPDWTAMANVGVAKAKAGDIDGAKASCKTCHDAYKESYKLTMRDRPWGG